MSGNEGPGTPDEVPEEYAATYRDAYQRALDEGLDIFADQSADQPQPVVPTDDGLVKLRVPLLVAALVLVLAVAGFGIGRLLGGGDDPGASAGSTPSGRPSQQAPSRPPSSPSGPSTSPATSATPPAGKPWTGVVTAVTPDLVEATCTSKPGVDAAGDPVLYEATNMIDGDPTTAWRCDGTGIGTKLTITIPDGTEVAELGLIPGYAKTDAKSGADRYAENNRITKVRWTLENGVTVTQVLDPSPTDRSVQTMRIPRSASGTITLEILAVARGARNTTAISEVEVAAAG